MTDAKRILHSRFAESIPSAGPLSFPPFSLAPGSLARVLAAVICLGACVQSAVASSVVAQPAGGSGTELRTEHYDLYVEGLDAAEVGNMLEQLHAQLTRYFGSAPSGRLPLALYATREKWAAALQADGQAVLYAGGYYAPATRKAYVWVQPSAYFTRHVLLHEATHQFHWLTSTGNQFPSTNWYTEGLAEYFAMHNWDGRRLQTGVIPAITLEDYPAKALWKFEAAGSDLGAMLPRAGRPESWALVHFLVNKYPDQFRQLSAGLDQRADADETWKRAFGRDYASFSQEYREWIVSHSQPWQIVWIGWQQRGEAIESESKANAMTILKQTPQALTVDIQPQTAGGAAGLVFAYQSPTEFHLFQVIGDHKIRIMHRQGGAWATVSESDLKRGNGDDVLKVSQEGGSTTLWANGEKIATLPTTGRVGLSVDGCRTLFRVREVAGG
ncbi:MAG: hypothetical protein WC869_06975 [Phycisphaerae bacterium]